MSPKANPKGATLALQLGLEVLCCLAAGGFLYLLWRQGGLPHPIPRELLSPDQSPAAELGVFLSLLVPAVFGLPSLVLGGLIWLSPRGGDGEGGAAAARESCLRWDAASYLLLPAAALVPLVAEELGAWLLALGLVLLGVVSFKAGLLIHYYWQALLPGRGGRGGGGGASAGLGAVLLVGVVVFLLAGWAGQFLPSDWAAGAAGAGAKAPGAGKLALLLRPWLGELLGFFGGRWILVGAQSLLLGGVALVVFAWLGVLGLPSGHRAAAAGLLLGSLPVLAAAWEPGSLLGLGLLLLVLALRLLEAARRRPLAAALGIWLLAGCLYLLEPGWLPLALGLVVAWGLDVATWRGRGWGLALGLVLGGAAAGAAGAWLGWPAEAAGRGLRSLAVGGLWFLLGAPVWLLALAAWPAGLARWPRLALICLVPACCHLAGRWLGVGGPGGLAGWVMLLPLGAPFLALALELAWRPRRWFLVLAVAVPTLLQGLMGCLLPRLAGPGAVTARLQELWGRSGGGLLPLAGAPRPVLEFWWAGAAVLALVLAAFFWLWARRPEPAGGEAPWPSPEGFYLLALILAGLAAGWLWLLGFVFQAGA